MTRFYAYFRPEHFYPVPVGTILRYAGHDYNRDKDQYSVIMDIIGEAPKQDPKLFPEIVFVDTSMINIPNVKGD